MYFNCNYSIFSRNNNNLKYSYDWVIKIGIGVIHNINNNLIKYHLISYK